MLRKLTLLFFIVTVSGCGVSGHYRSAGPCKGFHTHPERCERAAENSQAIGNIQIGQSIKEVLKIMGHSPEHREATKEKEEWRYLTSYEGNTYTTIIFKDGVVSEIK